MLEPCYESPHYVNAASAVNFEQIPAGVGNTTTSTLISSPQTVQHVSGPCIDINPVPMTALSPAQYQQQHHATVEEKRMQLLLQSSYNYSPPVTSTAIVPDGTQYHIHPPYNVPAPTAAQFVNMNMNVTHAGVLGSSHTHFPAGGVEVTPSEPANLLSFSAAERANAQPEDHHQLQQGVNGTSSSGNSVHVGKVPDMQMATAYRIGRYTPAERKVRLDRYREKRKQRNYAKRVKYDCRKMIADKRHRVQGRFVKREEEIALKEAKLKVKQNKTKPGEVETRTQNVECHVVYGSQEQEDTLVRTPCIDAQREDIDVQSHHGFLQDPEFSNSQDDAVERLDTPERAFDSPIRSVAALSAV